MHFPILTDYSQFHPLLIILLLTGQLCQTILRINWSYERHSIVSIVTLSYLGALSKLKFSQIPIMFCKTGALPKSQLFKNT